MHKEHLDKESYSGLQTTIYKKPSSDFSASYSPYFSGSAANYSEGDRLAFKQGCNSTSQSSQGSVSVQNFHCTQAFRGLQGHHRSQTLEQIHKENFLQDGKSSCHRTSPGTELFHVFNRPNRRIFYDSYSPRPSPLSVFPVDESTLPVCVPAVRFNFSSKDFYQGNESSTCSGSRSGDSLQQFHRRYFQHSSASGHLSSQHGFSTRSLPTSGVYSQHQEVASSSVSDTHALRSPLQHGVNDSFVAPGQGTDNYPFCYSFAQQRVGFPSQDSENVRSHRECQRLDVHRGMSLSSSSTAANQAFVSTSMGVSHCPVRGGQSRSSLVDSSFTVPQRSAASSASPRLDNPGRRLPFGMGSSMRSAFNSGVMDFSRENSPHQHLGVEGSISGNPVVCAGQIKSLRCPSVGQQVGSCISQSSGGGEVSSAVRGSSPGLALLRVSKHHSVSNVLTRGGKFASRSAIQIIPGASRLPAQPRGVQTGLQGFSYSSHRPFCKSQYRSAATLRFLEARPQSFCSRRVQFLLEGQGLVHVSPSRSCLALPSQDSPRRGKDLVCSASLEDKTVVSAPASVGMQLSATTSGSSIATSRSTHRLPARVQRCSSSRVEALRASYRGKGLSPQATDILIRAVCIKTSRLYDSKWNRFAGWCSQRSTNPLSCPVSYIIEFLTELFHEHHLAYSTLNGYRSAISSTHEHIDHQPVGVHPLVTLLFKGFFRLRPPLPRYTVLWDVAIVLKYLKTLHPSKSLSLKQLTLKTCMLIALTSSDRGQTLSLLDIRYCTFSHRECIFVIPNITKTSSVSRPSRVVKCPSFSVASLDVRHYVRHYIKRTTRCRDFVVSSGHTRPSRLFISFVKPFHEVSSQTIARWIRTILNAAGIDTSKFKAHSTRGASTSTALRQGASSAQILQLGDWSSECTFTRFYRRHVDGSDTGRLILQAALDQTSASHL